MSTVIEDYEEDRKEKADKRSIEYNVLTYSDRRVLVAYPGQVSRFGINIKDPINHCIAVIPEGLSESIASISLAPDRGIAPYTVKAVIRVNFSASPGFYPFNIIVYDLTSNELLGKERLALIILKLGIPALFVKRYRKLVNVYTKRGAMWLIWHLLKEVFSNGATFGQLKTAYELVRCEEIPNGTIGNILKRMIGKRIIYRDDNEVYHLLIDNPLVVDSRIDEKRAHVNTSKGATHTQSQRDNREPYAARLAFQRALKIKQEYGVLPALYFLAHTAMGARMTGYLLYWYNDWFIVCEKKTCFCHHFYSPYISQMLQRLCVEEGIQYKNTPEHQRAKKILLDTFINTTRASPTPEEYTTR